MLLISSNVGCFLSSVPGRNLYRLQSTHSKFPHPFQDTISYDNSCKLHQYIMLNRHPSHFKNMSFFVDWHSATVALTPDQISWLQLLYFKSVRGLVQWSLRFLGDPQALSSTLISFRCYSLGPSGLLKCVETLDSVSNYYI